MRQTLRMGLLVLATVVALAAASCGGGTEKGTPRTGLLLFGDQRGIVELNVETDLDRVLVARPTQVTELRDPAVSPDGARLVFTSTAGIRIPGAGREVNGDLWIADRDGANPRLLASHVAPNTGLASPQWMDDTTVLAASVSLADANTASTYQSRIVRIDTASGATSDLVANARAFGISPDGSSIVFASAIERSLASVGLQNPGTVTPLVAEGTLLFITSPRYSPDGLTIAFVAFDAATYPPKSAEDEPIASLWRMSPNGENLTRIASFLADDRSGVTWSGDGATIFVLGSESIAAIDVLSGEIETLHEPVNLLSTITWQPAPPKTEPE